MTTVINLNVFNYYKLDPDRFRAADLDLNPLASDRNKDYSAVKEEVIDVTDSYRVVADEEVVRSENSGFPTHLKESLAGKTYNRKGHKVPLFQAKGIYVDSFV